MDYIIRTLKLNKLISNVKDTISDDGTSAILAYRSLVKKNDLEPAKEDHLYGGENEETIPEGTYLFTQGPSLPTDRALRIEAFRDASEALWLESLWLEVEFKTDRILVRILSEDSKEIFQVFREITVNSR